ncbi:MAG: YwaF family protein, partial [Acholeplasmataceae bacterium]|nr:YwaF family protein [Acholeplasmataceae bacterium]
MDFLNRLMSLLNGDMNKPVAYQSFAESWFHYLALILTVLAAIAAATRLKNASEKKIKIFLISMASLMLVFEVYKQLNFSYNVGWGYQWYAFPFQFCSTPMYVALVAGLLSKGKVQNALFSFLGTYGLFAGAAVMLYPATVFINTIGINMQTMVHHGSMTVIGVAMLTRRVKLQHRSILPATAVFVVLVVMAMLMNLIHNTYIQNGTFNMFFINPQFDNGLPILD